MPTNRERNQAVEEIRDHIHNTEENHKRTEEVLATQPLSSNVRADLETRNAHREQSLNDFKEALYDEL
ncbi:hypothetical protein [Ferroacidibacillus organovorans]|uniref:Small, acid-soluble spore protein Tlp n=1 Tax=Ferroacidibacillus organovorans TaxID=1765683 RepID=A0A162TIP0_9BACL|nr:hypothetical protein [Ferroacidibacillus organovorans]KYP80844.1 hypothetical protein AYJ22_01410 [Ferroacidibacillus organovorans]OAG95389.1 hypothetical protein AYW79_00290 [Ferroacidibacillus organovorans]OPG15774.1 hypothetical protein B2M26_09150 [Ferroacidibacillus organovorans]